MIAPPWVPVPPPAYGGTELVLDGLCRGLKSLGHEVLLFATGDSSCPVELKWDIEEAPGVESFDSATEMRHVIAAYDAVAAWRPEVVHDHTTFGPFYAERFPHLPLVVTAHHPFDGSHGAVYRSLAERTALIAISHHQAATARVPIAAVIHHAVDIDAVAAGKGDGGYAAFLGRMNPAKGVTVAIRAARAAGMPLLMAAKMQDHEEHRFFDEHVKPLLGDDIEYVGEVGGMRKQHLLQDARCLLNPISWPEPFGMVMIEAMACGTPVVATPNGAAREIVEDGLTGFLRSDEDALATALGKIDTIDRIVCREVAERRFSLERLALDHLAVYEAVASRPR